MNVYVLSSSLFFELLLLQRARSLTPYTKTLVFSNFGGIATSKVRLKEGLRNGWNLYEGNIKTVLFLPSSAIRKLISTVLVLHPGAKEGLKLFLSFPQAHFTCCWILPSGFRCTSDVGRWSFTHAQFTCFYPPLPFPLPHVVFYPPPAVVFHSGTFYPSLFHKKKFRNSL